MKIDGSYYKTITSAALYSCNTERYNSAVINTKTSEMQGDTVEISDDALNMEKANIREISREERINILQSQVQSGTYKFSIEDIADKIMERIA